MSSEQFPTNKIRCESSCASLGTADNHILCRDPRGQPFTTVCGIKWKQLQALVFIFLLKGLRFLHFWSLFFIYYCYLGCYKRLWKLNKYDPSCHSVLGTISDSPHERCYWVPLIGGGRLEPHVLQPKHRSSQQQHWWSYCSPACCVDTRLMAFTCIS